MYIKCKVFQTKFMRILLISLLIILFSLTAGANVKFSKGFYVNGSQNYCSYTGYLQYELELKLDNICKKGYSIHVRLKNGGVYPFFINNHALQEYISKLCDFEKQIIVNNATKEHDEASFVCASRD